MNIERVTYTPHKTRLEERKKLEMNVQSGINQMKSLARTRHAKKSSAPN